MRKSAGMRSDKRFRALDVRCDRSEKFPVRLCVRRKIMKLLDQGNYNGRGVLFIFRIKLRFIFNFGTCLFHFQLFMSLFPLSYCVSSVSISLSVCVCAVSYTHLDVYKRQLVIVSRNNQGQVQVIRLS